MSLHPPIDLDDEEGAACALFSVPALLSRKSARELEQFSARVAALAERPGLHLRASVETCEDPAMLWAIHEELMRRGVPPILRGPRSWDLGAQGRLVEFAADLAWLSLNYPAHRGRYGLAKAIFKTRWSSDGWWELVLRQFGRTGHVRGLVLALGLGDEQRQYLRTLLTALRARLFARLHGDSFGRLIECVEITLKERPDKSGQTNPRATAVRRAQLWRIYRLLGEGPTGTAHCWKLLSGETLTRQQVAKQLTAVEKVALAFERGPFDVETVHSLR